MAQHDLSAGRARIAAAFLLLAVLWTWPVAATLTTKIANDAGDPLLNTWILWWNAHAVPFTAAWWHPAVMWPMRGAMALSEHLVGLSLVATPLQSIGMGPIGAYNVSLLLTYALSGFFAYLLVLHLTGSRLAAVCGGLAFGFSPYRASQLSHIQVLSSQWMPLALLGMHGYLETRLPRWLVLFGAAWLMLALSNNYYVLFFPVLIALWLIWFVDWRRAPRAGAALVAAWTATSLPLLPILLKYKAVHGALDLKRTIADVRAFSALPESFVQPPPALRVYPQGTAPNFELYLFPGIAVIALATIAVAMTIARRNDQSQRARSTAVIFYVSTAIVMAVLALGPGDAGNGTASLARPFSWLLLLPGYDGIRVPARFMMIATLCLSVAAGYGVALLTTVTRRWQPLLGVIAIAGLAADGLTEPVPVVSPPAKAMAVTSGDPAVIELPIDDPYVNVAAMYRSIFHGRPLVNGYSGHIPPHYGILMLSLARGDSSPLVYLARRRPLVVIVNDLQDPGHGYRRMIEAIPGIQFQGVTGGGAVFVLPPQPEPRRPPIGLRVAATVRDAGRFVLEFDLGRTQRLSAIEIPLRNRYRDFAPRLRITTSDDGESWREVWGDWTGSLAVEAAVADPLQVPVHIDLPGASGRFVRIYPSSEWMRDEVRVIGDR